MKVGVTGHQSRPGIDWDWVRTSINIELAGLPSPILGLSSLAIGSDQIFAEIILSSGQQLLAVIPQFGYEKHFNGQHLSNFYKLLKHAKVVQLQEQENEEAFLKAGIYIVDNSDILFAVWDGKSANGKGGTADVVAYARSVAKKIVHFEPTNQTITR